MQKNIKIHYSLKKRKCLPKPESISHLRITLKDLSEGFCVIKHLCKSFMPVPQLSTHPNFTIGMKDQCVHLGTVFESLSTCRESKSNKSEATNFTRNKTKTHPAVSWHPWRKLPEVKSCFWKLENWGRDSARELLGDNSFLPSCHPGELSCGGLVATIPAPSSAGGRSASSSARAALLPKACSRHHN